MDKKKNLIGYIVIGILLASVAIFIIYMGNKNQRKFEYPLAKNYKINEYIPTFLTDNDMSKIYFNDFISTVISNPEESYLLLDEEYRNLKYPTYSSYYNEYASNVTIDKRVKKYYKDSVGKYIIFGVYDESDNLYIFKTNGVMQYSVYLDDYTVEIGD